MKIPQSSILLNFYNDLPSFNCVYSSAKTNIYNTFGGYTILTKEKVKYEYYKYAIKNKFKHIPKIYDMCEDFKNSIYIIKREKLYPIIDINKLIRLQIVQQALIDRAAINDNIIKEALKFYDENSAIEFDFGPHCFMQTKNKKIVISDLFRGI